MITAIVVAAGFGKRMESNDSKPFLSLAGKPLLVWTLEAVAKSLVDNIIITAHPKEINRMIDLVNEYSIAKVSAIIRGGDARQDSVYAALKVLPENCKIVAIHDGARPLIKPEFVNKIIQELGKEDGIIPAIMPTDTIKKSSNNYVEKTLNRQELRAVQTPQVFKKEALLESYTEAYKDNFYGTDDASLLEVAGFKVKISEGRYDNIKVTTPTDLLFAEALLK